MEIYLSLHEIKMLLLGLNGLAAAEGDPIDLLYRKLMRQEMKIKMQAQAELYTFIQKG